MHTDGAFGLLGLGLSKDECHDRNPRRELRRLGDYLRMFWTFPNPHRDVTAYPEFEQRFGTTLLLHPGGGGRHVATYYIAENAVRRNKFMCYDEKTIRLSEEINVLENGVNVTKDWSMTVHKFVTTPEPRCIFNLSATMETLFCYEKDVYWDGDLVHQMKTAHFSECQLACRAHRACQVWVWVPPPLPVTKVVAGTCMFRSAVYRSSLSAHVVSGLGDCHNFANHMFLGSTLRLRSHQEFMQQGFIEPSNEMLESLGVPHPQGKTSARYFKMHPEGTVPWEPPKIGTDSEPPIGLS
eukprot:TRINITY_DN254_c0_g1_i1.p1 TRINITY_DN254_c0_g1~~TRINITY_DN254_c0_g1_i1.p1  ORF type:complete len:296 (+),score=11.09 TRINITY_DN254_c0_g1_i1:380-1267(+)